MQKSITFLLHILLVVFLVSAGRAQDPKQPDPKQQEPTAIPCPQVNVQPPAFQEVRDGQPVTFTANIAGGDPKVKPTILWSISAGAISTGQGTNTIVVDSTGASAPDREINAVVWVGGYAPECVLQASATVRVIGPAVKYGEFGVVPDEIVTKNLKAVAKFLSQSPDDLWLIVYAGRHSERGFASDWLKRLKAELIADGVPVRRIQAIDGGFREQPLFDFWIVPRGAVPPRAAPTIDRREIVYPKAPPQKKT